MNTVLYFKINKIWGDEVFKQQFSLLPHKLQQKIGTYKSKHDQQLRICGKLMLYQLMSDFELTPEYGLNDIEYDYFNKPFINENFNFSIAHSEDFVVCAAASKKSIGIDIEKIKPRDILLLKEYFTKEEWLFLEERKYNLEYFYYLWTRKEAVLKAIGKGIYEEMQQVPVLKNEIIYNRQSYYIYDITIDTNYKIAVACNIKDIFEVKEFNIIGI